MPQFIKMGLGGTGYRGKPGSSLRAQQRATTRRKVLPGYPVEIPFQSIEEVREYFSGDYIDCLICGRTFKALARHLEKIHGVTCDEYRSAYKIPWTYGLISEQARQLASKVMKKRMEEGYKPPEQRGSAHKQMISVKKRINPFKKEVAIQNLPEYEVVGNEKGLPSSKTAIARSKHTQQGTPEFHTVMQGRPQCQPSVAAEGIGKYWKGKKQSPNHIKKRITKGLATRKTKKLQGKEGDE